MSAVAALILLAWAVEALTLGYVMRRRGYDGYVWTLLGTTLGPIALALAVSSVIRPPSRESTLLHAGHRGAGHLDVLVGVDGSRESDTAVGRVAALLGQPVGRVTLARVVPLDASREIEQAATAQLEAARVSHPKVGPSTVLLRGVPSTALHDYAADLGYELLVVGTRGAGKTAALLGSVATQLARGSDIPVLLVDDSPSAAPSKGSAVVTPREHAAS